MPSGLSSLAGSVFSAVIPEAFMIVGAHPSIEFASFDRPSLHGRCDFRNTR